MVIADGQLNLDFLGVERRALVSATSLAPVAP